MNVLLSAAGAAGAAAMFAFAYHTWKEQGEPDETLPGLEPRFFSRQEHPFRFWTSLIADVAVGVVVLAVSVAALKTGF